MADRAMAYLQRRCAVPSVHNRRGRYRAAADKRSRLRDFHACKHHGPDSRQPTLWGNRPTSRQGVLEELYLEGLRGNSCDQHGRPLLSRERMQRSIFGAVWEHEED